MPRETLLLFGGVVGVLVIASIISAILGRRGESPVLTNLRQRTNTWWVMSAIFAVAAFIGPIGSMLLFALISFMALREFITLTPTRRGDHCALFWVFFVAPPLHYYFVATNNYGMFTILIPIYAFLFIPARIALSGDSECFLERAAKIQWGLMVCVYCVSHAPAILTLNIPGYEGKNSALLLFFMIVTQLN
ncbi:phosphatidate cytidylyltransferase, partial [bacterium]